MKKNDKISNKKHRVLIITLIILGIIFLVIVNQISENYKMSKEQKEELAEINKNISFEISDKFERNNEDSIWYHYFDTDNYISCTFSIKTLYSGKDDGKEYLEEDIYFNKKTKVSEIEKVEINNHMWYKMVTEDDNKINYYYTTSKGEKGFIVEYEIRDDNKADWNKTEPLCYTEYENVISSIKIK